MPLELVKLHTIHVPIVLLEAIALVVLLQQSHVLQAIFVLQEHSLPLNFLAHLRQCALRPVAQPTRTVWLVLQVCSVWKVRVLLLIAHLDKIALVHHGLQVPAKVALTHLEEFASNVQLDITALQADLLDLNVLQVLILQA